MENINLGAGSPTPGAGPKDTDKNQSQPVNPLPQPTTGSKPDSISINFTPKTPEVTPVMPAEDKLKVSAENKTPASSNNATPGNMPQVMSMEIKRDDLNKTAPASTTPAAEKKGFLSGLFGKKTEPVTKPSTAWGNALDVSKDSKKPGDAPVVKPALSQSLNISTPTNNPVKTATPTTSGPIAISNKPAEKPDFFTSAALQEKSGSSKLMENIVTQKAQLEQPKIEDLLGKKSTILEKSIEQESQLKLKKKLRLMQFFAFMVAVVAIIVNGYLYYELSPGLDLLGYAKYNFDSNLRNDVFNLNQSLKSVQTNLNKYRYLSGQLYLDQFGYESTRFIDGINNLEAPGLASEKNEIQSVVTEAKNAMPDLLAGAKQNLSQPIVVDTYPTRGEEQVDTTLIEGDFQRLLKLSISEEKKALLESSKEGSLELPAGALSFFDNAARLVGNNKLIANLKARTIDAFKLDVDDYENTNDSAQRAIFRKYINDLLTSTKVNLATITNLRNARIAWTDVVNRLEQITNQVNSEHNSGLGSSNASQITYSNFDLNSDTGKISISGINTTRDGTNRAVVTYLITAFEESPEFKNVSDRSFPLSKSTDLNGQDVYTMNFKIDMELESGAFSKANLPIADLQSQKVVAVKIPVKRNN